MLVILLLTLGSPMPQETVDLNFLCQKVIEHDRHWMQLQGEWTETSTGSSEVSKEKSTSNTKHTLRVNGHHFVHTIESVNKTAESSTLMTLVNDRYTAQLISTSDGKWQVTELLSRVYDRARLERGGMPTRFIQQFFHERPCSHRR